MTACTILSFRYEILYWDLYLWYFWQRSTTDIGKSLAFAYIVSLILCVLVFVPKIGSSSHGSSRWIGIGPIQFQPSEVAKIAVILFMAMIIDKIPKQFDKFLSLVKVLAMLIPLIIVVAISNLSTAVIIIGISVCMLFVASPKYLQFIIVAVAVVVFAVAFVMLAGYRSTRIEAWLHPETAEQTQYSRL